MTVLTEGKHAGDFIVSEANGSRSRSAAVLTLGQNLEAGAIVTVAAGEYVEFAAGDTDVAILFDNADATTVAQNVVVLDADCEVNGAELVWDAALLVAEVDAGIVALAAKGIKIL